MKISARLCSALVLLASITITQQVRAQDLSTVAIVSPVSGCALASTETVTVKLFNYGPALTAGTSFNVSYSINAGAPVTEMVTLGATLLTNSSLTYTFTTAANLSTPGSYTFAASVALPGDTNPTNNSMSGYLVTSTAPPVCGTLSGAPAPSCATAQAAVLTLSGHAGTVQRWERSTDGGSTWTILDATTSTLPITTSPTTTTYRAIVGRGICGEATSSSVTVSELPHPAPTLVAADVVCPGATLQPAAIVNPAAYSGFAWTASNATITSASNGGSIAWTAPASGVAMLSAEVTGTNTCKTTVTHYAIADASACLASPPHRTLVLTDANVGAACDTTGQGGLRIRVGVDDGAGGGTPDDDVLQDGEVDQTSYVCNGANGMDGMDGTNGTNGVDGKDGGCAFASRPTSPSALGLMLAALALTLSRRVGSRPRLESAAPSAQATRRIRTARRSVRALLVHRA